MDLVVGSEHFPAPGETIFGGGFLMNPGGKGANQAVAAKRLGGNVCFISKLGNDLFGHELLELYRLENINTDFILKDLDNPTAVAIINIDAKGENNILVASGANASLSKYDIKQIKYCLNDCDILLIQLEIPIDTIKYAASLAKSKGVKIILNPAPAQKLPDSLLSSLYIITPNKTEAELLSGMKITDMESVREVADNIAAKGVENVIITLGSDGVFVKEKDEYYFIEAFKVKAIDTSVAGDTFSGGLCAALSGGFNLRQAVKFASRAASISVTRIGARASIPYRHELAGLY